MDDLGSFRKLEETGEIDRLTLGWLGDGGSYGMKPARVYSFELVNRDDPAEPGEDVGGISMEMAAAWPKLPLEERENHAREGFFLAIDNLEKLFPERGHLFLAGVAAQAMRALEEALESGQVSWDNPTIEARFIVSWDFENDLPDLPVHSDEELETFYGTHLAFVRLVRDFIARRSFMSFHGPMWLRHHDDGQLEIMIPAPLKEKARRENPTPEAELKAVMEMARPIRWPMSGLEGDGFTAVPVIAFAPCHMAQKEGLAFYPVLVHLGMKGENSDPRAWPATKREAMWGWFRKQILLLIQGLIEDLDKKAEAASAEAWAKAEEAGDRPADPAEKGAVLAVANRQPEEEQWRPAPDKAELAPAPSFGPGKLLCLLDGEALVDRNTIDLVRSLVGGLPRRLASVPKWEDLKQKEIRDILEREGAARAQENLRGRTKNPDARGPLLEVEGFLHNGEPVYRLTREAEAELRATAGAKGFREVRVEEDGVARESIVKVARSGSGPVETSLSWYGLAAPLAIDGLEEVEASALRQNQPVLFEDLKNEDQDRIERALRYVGAIRDAKLVMVRALDLLGPRRANPVRITAAELYTLLQCETDPHRRKRVEGCLRALQELRFNVALGGGKRRVRGPFLGQYEYKGELAGGRGEGTYYLSIQNGFLGCLALFSLAGPRIRGGRELTAFDWGKTLTKEERKSLKGDGGYIRSISSISPYVSIAHGLTETQANLHRFIAGNITRKRDAVTKLLGDYHDRKQEQAAGRDADAMEPRIYRSNFCPLLKGGEYHAALGGFRRSPEAGFTLAGTPTAGSGKSGGHKGGLLYQMGVYLPSGSAVQEREQITEQALLDLEAVACKVMGGVVAARYEGRWLSLVKASELVPVEGLLHKVNWFLFPAADWQERGREAVERHHEDRHARGETPYQVKVTTSPLEEEQAERIRRGEHISPEQARGGAGQPLPLHNRLRRAWKRSGFSQAQIAEALGVSRPMVTNWVNGTKAIPLERVDQIEDWIKTAEERQAGREP